MTNVDKILTKYDKEQLFREFENYLNQKEQKNEILIPVSVFSAELSPLESIVKFLVENSGLGFAAVGNLLKKDRRVIWSTYKRASKKSPAPFSDSPSDIKIPISKLSSDKLQVTELIVAYLKDELSMKNSKISAIMKKDPRTVWTFYSRFKKKGGGNP